MLYSNKRVSCFFCFLPQIGIIRYARPESVELALEEWKKSEIEIQDVSVSVKTLKSERTSYS